MPAATRWAAVGTSTARALMARGIVPDLVPPVAVSDALVEVFPEAVATGSAPGRGSRRVRCSSSGPNGCGTWWCPG